MVRVSKKALLRSGLNFRVRAQARTSFGQWRHLRGLARLHLLLATAKDKKEELKLSKTIEKHVAHTSPDNLAMVQAQASDFLSALRLPPSPDARKYVIKFTAPLDDAAVLLWQNLFPEIIHLQQRARVDPMYSIFRKKDERE